MDNNLEIYTLRNTLDHVGAYVFTKDAECRYTYANKMVCDLFGAPLSEIVGKTDDDFFDLELSKQLHGNDLKALAGESIEGEEHNYIASTGETRIYWSVKQPIKDLDGHIIGLCGISTDITERRRLENELAEQRNLLNQVLENIDSYVYIKDKEGRYLYVNQNTAELYGVPKEKIIGELEKNILPGDIAHKLSLMDKKVFESGAKVTGEEIVSHADGSMQHCWSIKIPIASDDGSERLIGISTDITELIELKNKFQELAKRDELTKVMTRRFILEEAELLLKLAQRRHYQLAAIMIDIDNFKMVNDTYGHVFGDSYIVAITDACVGVIGEEDLIGRLGGDEFLIIMDETNPEAVSDAARQILKAVNGIDIKDPAGEPIAASVSIGCALSAEGMTLIDLIGKADDGLYTAKEAGRGRWYLSG
ncbi:MAG: diguanylate cyclase [Oceanospirillum sp.]|nr:diguanylate cyclase [Oceanospirillum sp.]